MGLRELGEGSHVGVAGIEVRLQYYQDKVDDDEMRMMWRIAVMDLAFKMLS